ncbi:hypothetical protein LUZ63_005541 [Rhynchospora breviuscula]|uniref:BSD domain-containing protein n=1 Tax=Rhynchospora breviuscula TaxID=2022672 RepID=A0A9Q0CN23_9POAL|nr:hypothetical protein LUZ63_005541 [Rhynchospora breviuscula]
MSWLARSIAKTLLPSDDEEEEQEKPSATTSAASDDAGDPQAPTKGVKEDISELTQTLSRQFRGFASFLAPPPQSQPESKTSHDGDDDVEASDSPRKMPGIRSDFAEIGGRVRSGISKISEHVAVSEIAKIASSFLPLGSDEDEDLGVVGLTEEVLMFVEDISMHPETWLDFPLLEEESDDFEMSDLQQEHALAMEQLVPRLAALRIELCPNHMSERCFWNIYFLLVYPKLDVKDAELLFSPQIMHARMQPSSNFQSQNKEAQEYDSATVEVPILEVPTLDVPQKTPNNITTLPEQGSEEPPSKDIYDIPSSSSTAAAASSSAPSSSKVKEEETLTTIPISDVVESEKHPVEVTEVKIVDKSVIKEEEPATKAPVAVQKFEYSEDSDGDEEWLQEDTTDDTPGVSQNTANVPLGDDEDVSFSDLEDEDDKK